ncbi:MAG: hypothetical protein HYZ84_00895 [Candidatus Omnitrophica bacterium]|nr:hypothetical protein [Candidatus Omnitrophota bacterium]
MNVRKIYIAMLIGIFSVAAIFSKDGKKEEKLAKAEQEKIVVQQAPAIEVKAEIPPRPPKIESVPDLPRPSIPQALKAPSVDPSMNRIQKEIQEVIKLNEELKSRYKSQAAEIQRISEQARIHQKILQDMNQMPRKVPVIKPQDTEELLKQEKLRVIEQDTEASRKFIEDLKNAPPDQAAPPAKADSAAKAS